MKLIAPVEEEVRRLLGRHVFAADEETIEQAVGTLLRESGRTVSVFEDATGGMLAGRLYQSAPDQFASGVIGNGEATIVRLMGEAGRLSSPDATDGPEELTRQLAAAIRSQGGSDLGIALHAVLDPTERAENLGRGQTYVAVTDGDGFRERIYQFGGRGRPDRTRMSFKRRRAAPAGAAGGFDR